MAAVAVRHDHGVLTVPLLRVANTGLADTLSRQMLFQFAVDRCAAGEEVEHHAAVAARAAGLLEPAPLRSGMPAVAAAELERTWWPAKLADSELPTYVIPIRQVFSAELLGVPEGLIPRHDNLGLAREHVYYRSPVGLRLEAPARLLWYMSSTSPRQVRLRRGRAPRAAYPAGVIACSQLDSVVTGAPDELFERFRHLGVWDQWQIYGAVRRGRVQALRFTNTELLAHVSKSRLRALATVHRQTGLPPRWPTRISAALFAALYQEGRRR